MIKIGQLNILKVARRVEFGLYLADEEGNEVLLPNRYVGEDAKIGNEVEVFVYTDSDDRIVATTERPVAMVNEFAVLPVVAVNRIGAFLDWGLMKDLLVPFSEQKTTMKVGRSYPVYVYLDDASQRVVASGRIEKFLGNIEPYYKVGDKVSAKAWRPTPIGMSCVVDNLFQGMVYENQTFRPIEVGQCFDAWVSRVRQDGKIDLRIDPPHSGRSRTENVACQIVDAMSMSGGQLDMNDRSTPDEIRRRFQCSKRDFKQAIGHLLKDGKICQTERGLMLLKNGKSLDD